METKDNYNQGLLSISIREKTIAVSGIIIIIEENLKLP